MLPVPATVQLRLFSLRFFCLALCFSFLACGASGQTGRKLALIIGINRYVNKNADGSKVNSPIDSLEFAVNDALAMYDTLLNNGFKKDDIRLLITKPVTEKDVSDKHYLDYVTAARGEPTVLEIRRGLDWLVNEAAKKIDQVLVFYSGHGAEFKTTSSDKAQAYLLPSDAAPTSSISGTEYELTSEGESSVFAFAQIPQRLMGKDNITNFFIAIDMCRKPPVKDKAGLGDGVGESFKARAKELIKFNPPSEGADTVTRSGAVLFSSQPNKPSFEDRERKHGYMTASLLDGMNGKLTGVADSKGRIMIQPLVEAVRRAVSDVAKPPNTPLVQIPDDWVQPKQPEFEISKGTPDLPDPDELRKLILGDEPDVTKASQWCEACLKTLNRFKDKYDAKQLDRHKRELKRHLAGFYSESKDKKWPDFAISPAAKMIIEYAGFMPTVGEPALSTFVAQASGGKWAEAKEFIVSNALRIKRALDDKSLDVSDVANAARGRLNDGDVFETLKLLSTAEVVKSRFYEDLVASVIPNKLDSKPDLALANINRYLDVYPSDIIALAWSGLAYLKQPQPDFKNAKKQHGRAIVLTPRGSFPNPLTSLEKKLIDRGNEILKELPAQFIAARNSASFQPQRFAEQIQDSIEELPDVQEAKPCKTELQIFLARVYAYFSRKYSDGQHIIFQARDWAGTRSALEAVSNTVDNPQLLLALAELIAAADLTDSVQKSEELYKKLPDTLADKFLGLAAIHYRKDVKAASGYLKEYERIVGRASDQIPDALYRQLSAFISDQLKKPDPGNSAEQMKTAALEEARQKANELLRSADDDLRKGFGGLTSAVRKLSMAITLDPIKEDFGKLEQARRDLALALMLLHEDEPGLEAIHKALSDAPNSPAYFLEKGEELTRKALDAVERAFRAEKPLSGTALQQLSDAKADFEELRLTTLPAVPALVSLASFRAAKDCIRSAYSIQQLGRELGSSEWEKLVADLRAVAKNKLDNVRRTDLPDPFELDFWKGRIELIELLDGDHPVDRYRMAVKSIGEAERSGAGGNRSEIHAYLALAYWGLAKQDKKDEKSARQDQARNWMNQALKEGFIDRFGYLREMTGK